MSSIPGCGMQVSGWLNGPLFSTLYLVVSMYDSDTARSSVKEPSPGRRETPSTIQVPRLDLPEITGGGSDLPLKNRGVHCAVVLAIVGSSRVFSTRVGGWFWAGSEAVWRRGARL
ncbi:hypothetical protein Hypma_014250 [Hypsizygus marmoreus]|uniref:Uncharacterized protein n=1 Tax=Hypsizygus marmoreus TaxID=39966 RepID=A0A369JET5_HYPMA|nr:hypothetical protein Hypma_014250 [Hypsizygus marmoreus]